MAVAIWLSWSGVNGFAIGEGERLGDDSEDEEDEEPKWAEKEGVR